MSATDRDGRDNTISYSLSGGNASLFAVDSNGVITHTSPFEEVTDADVSVILIV